MRRQILFLLGFCGAVLTSQVRADIAISEYLSQATQALPSNPEIALGDAGWAHRAEFRYDGNDQDEHSFALRYRPGSGGQRGAERQIRSLVGRRLEVENGARLNDELYLRYSRILDLIATASDHEYLVAKSAISREFLLLNRRRVQSENFRAAELQRAELEQRRDQQRLEIAKLRLHTETEAFADIDAASLRRFLDTWEQRVARWENFSVIGEVLLGLDRQQQLHAASDRVEFQLAQQELNLARSESRGWLKYVEVKWVDRASGEQETSLGFSIPLGRDDFGVARRAAALNRANLSLQAGRNELLRQVIRYVSGLGWQREQHRLMESGLRQLERQRNQPGGSAQPELLLEIEGEILDYRRRMRRAEIDRLRDYLDLLHAVGYLSRPPLSNWLFRDQPRLPGN